MLLGQLRADLTAAMKARDELRTATLRMTLAAIQEASVAGPVARELTDDEVQAVLSREAKRRDEAAEAFEAAGHGDRAARELAERDVIATYLPAALTDDELAELVASTLAAGGFTEPSQMGAAMKAVTAAVAGRAAGGRIAPLVKARLAGG